MYSISIGNASFIQGDKKYSLINIEIKLHSRAKIYQSKVSNKVLLSGSFTTKNIK